MPVKPNITIKNWEASSKPQLLNLTPYKKLFPPAEGIDKTVMKNAGVSHTVAFIPQVVKQCSWQVENYVKQELRHLPLEQACNKLWHFVRHHIEWVKDADNKEQVRSPRRLIADGKGDCDCMTTFVDTCMSVYGVKGITNRITTYYGNENFSHIYSLIPDGKGAYYIIDCCYPQFNQEKSYTKKKDYNMDLQFLDGIDDTTGNTHPVSSTKSRLEELGRLLRKKVAPQANTVFKKRSPEQKQEKKEKRQAVIKKTVKVVNKVNRVNPATLLLRAGMLASMKLNLLKVAERIKWGYASPELAESKGMDMTKYPKVKAVLARAEKLFFVAGGKPENLRHAILTGKGNKNHEVSGLDNLGEDTPLAELLGAVYRNEFINDMEGLAGLGEPATAASITAAAGAMGALAALLANIGHLFPNKNKSLKREKKQQDENSEAEAENNVATEEASDKDDKEPNEENAEAENQEQGTNKNTPATQEETEVTETKTEEQTEESTEGLSGLMSIRAFYDTNKRWIQPVAAFTAGALVTLLVYELTGNDPKEKNRSNKGLEGHQTTKGEEDKDDKESIIALM